TPSSESGSSPTMLWQASCSSHERCLQAGGRRVVADGSVGTSKVVVHDEALEGFEALQVGRVGAAGRPLPLEGLDESFCFAIGLRPEWAGLLEGDAVMAGDIDEEP